MAPEVIQSSGYSGYSFSSDIWSIGVVMFEILTGYLPFDPDSEYPYDIYQCI
jgi:serine/threonine protein kinase